MTDIEDELLALAGDESGAEDVGPSGHQTTSPSLGAASPLPTTEQPPSPPPVRRGTAQKKMAKAKSGARKRKQDDSEEEGEASPAPSARSLGSDAMDESSSEGEADAPADDDDDIPYPLDGKFKDEADKARIQSLSQLEQEKILSERADDSLRRQQQIQLRQKIKEQEREKERLEGRNKRKAAAADLDDESRRATRPKTKRDEAMESLKRSRENNRKREVTRRLPTSRSHSPGSSDKDAEGESEVEWDDRPRTTGGSREEPLAEMHDIEHIRVGRSRFAECCFFPGFEEAITGCFVRVCVGTDRDGRPLYRMALIKGFSDGKPYKIEGQNRKIMMTDQYVLCTYGKLERPWQFIQCSDSRFLEAEFEHWKRTMQEDGCRLPNKHSLGKKINDVNALLHRTWTSAEIDEKLRKQNKFKDVLQSQAGEPQPMYSTQSDKLALINEQNRKRNAQEVRAALIAQRKKEIAARNEAIKKIQAEKAQKEAATAAKDSLALPQLEHDDLFSDPGEISRTASPAPVAKFANAKKIIKGEKKNGIPTFSRAMRDDEIISSLDLEIEVEI